MILDARPCVECKIEDLKNRVMRLNEIPKLVIIRVANDPASGKYVANKIKRCEEVGILSEVIHLEEEVSEDEVKEVINTLNADNKVTGVLLQLPLPETLDEDYLTSLISKEKDVDGFTEANMGKLMLSKDGLVACTPKGIMNLLDFYNVGLEGKDVLIINRSNIVGKPLALLFLEKNATVTIAHSKTKDLKTKIKNSDIVVTAVGRADFLCAEDFSPNTTIIDVSMNMNSEGKLCGDVKKSDLQTISETCSITPVPFGVGQTTVISLIEQTIQITEKKETLW